MFPESSARRQFRYIATRISVFISALVVAGCSHGVLTFFFTGVPEPGAEQVGETGQSELVTTASAKAPRRQVRVAQIKDFLHGPFGAVACTLCHLDNANRKVGTAPARSKPRPGQQLAYPIETLCVGCHSEKAAAQVASQGLWQHGPVANGWCTSCHSPHKTRRQYMLLQENNVAMCGQCHSTQALQRTPQHAGDPAVECTDCHNPHAGRDRLLLRAEYDERRRFGGS